MRKNQFSKASDKETKIFLLDDEEIKVEFRYSSRRRSTSLRLGKKGFILNTNPLVPQKDVEDFVKRTIPKLLEKERSKPLPVVDDNVYIFGKNEYVEGFSSWNKAKQHRYLKEILLPYVAQRVKDISKEMGVDVIYDTNVRAATSVYGINHRDKKTLMFSLSLVHFDKKTIDSVIAHELTHHFVLGHGKKFYKILLEHFPSYWECRKKLIRNIYD